MLRIIAYDIADPKRLRRAANTCLDYGVRIEKSVFECNLSNEQFDKLWEKLKDIANRDEDSLVCYPVCATCERNIATYGLTRHSAVPAVLVVD